MYMKNTMLGSPQFVINAHGISDKQETEPFGNWNQLSTGVGRACPPVASQGVYVDLASLPVMPASNLLPSSETILSQASKQGVQWMPATVCWRQFCYVNVMCILPIAGENIMGRERKTTYIIH